MTGPCGERTRASDEVARTSGRFQFGGACHCGGELALPLPLVTGNAMPAPPLRLLCGEAVEERLHRSVRIDAGERDARRPGDVRRSPTWGFAGASMAGAPSRKRCRLA